MLRWLIVWWRLRRSSGVLLDEKGFPLKFERQGPIKSAEILEYMRAVERGGPALSEEQDDKPSGDSGG